MTYGTFIHSEFEFDNYPVKHHDLLSITVYIPKQKGGTSRQSIREKPGYLLINCLLVLPFCLGMYTVIQRRSW